MRWMYADHLTATETQARDALLARIRDWWQSFEKHVPDIEAGFRQDFRSGAKWDLPGWMAESLQQIDPELMWEYGPGVHGEYRLVITPEHRHHLRPLVDTILQHAPRISGWEFYPHRLAEDMQTAAASVSARTDANLREMSFEARLEDNNRIDVTIAAPGAQFDAAFVALEVLLGEETLNKWIGNIEAVTPPRTGFVGRLLGRRPGDFLPMQRLRPTVEALVSSAREQLPEIAWLETPQDDRTYHSIKFQAPDAAVYPGRQDLMLGTSCLPAVSTARHRGDAFFSDRCSRVGETFCYLKLEATPDQIRVDDRGEIEDAIDAELVPAGIGCTLGGGTGREHCYIDLALLDVPRAIELIRSVLQAREVPLRAWLLFFDAALQSEWVGVWPDTPPPPHPPEDA